ncbi:hypothetical protein ACEYYA_12865 [Paracoccus sp. p3-h83]|uniref:hypothetical protein n=1 Tax=Paracoccus sp. p3-h83 TaxID=3342805 RepID=UPI0035B85B4B
MRPASLPWPKARVLEARAVIADVAHHSDHLVRLACNVLTTHGETEQERRDARALLYAIEARCPALHRRAQRTDHDDAPQVRR